jgi:hypothetical protein
MATRSKKPITKRLTRPRDVSQLAHQLVREATEKHESSAQPTNLEISRVMAELGRRGGKIGGRKRAESMSDEKRKQIARKAARARWDKREAV